MLDWKVVVTWPFEDGVTAAGAMVMNVSSRFDIETLLLDKGISVTNKEVANEPRKEEQRLERSTGHHRRSEIVHQRLLLFPASTSTSMVPNSTNCGVLSTERE